MSKRRVVVTGMGMLSPVGNTVETTWKALLAGQSGINLIDHFDTSAYATRFAGLVKGFNSSLEKHLTSITNIFSKSPNCNIIIFVK